MIHLKTFKQKSMPYPFPGSFMSELPGSWQSSETLTLNGHYFIPPVKQTLSKNTTFWV